MKIGNDILEVSSFGDFAFNGVDSPDLDTLSGYAVQHTQVNKKKHTFNVIVGKHENITISTFKDFVSVSITSGAESTKFFRNSNGLMGSYNSGSLLARDGTTVMEDMNDFGQEWQVQEWLLFRSTRSPQFPQKCILPGPRASGQRRLGENMARTTAEAACSHYSGIQFDNCVFDVLSVGDVDIATSGY